MHAPTPTPAAHASHASYARAVRNTRTRALGNTRLCDRLSQVLTGAVLDLYFKADRYSYTFGATGCVYGLVTAAIATAFAPLYAFLVLLDRTVTGAYNFVAERIDPQVAYKAK
eukprot:4778847-Pleurochrysis_carterae.AAC.1